MVLHEAVREGNVCCSRLNESGESSSVQQSAWCNGRDSKGDLHLLSERLGALKVLSDKQYTTHACLEVNENRSYTSQAAMALFMLCMLTE